MIMMIMMMMTLMMIIMLMMDDNDQRVQNVVCSAPTQGGTISSAAIYSRDGSARHVLGDSPEIASLCTEKSTVWIQDDKQHGPPLECCRGVSVLCASPKRSNYDRYIKLADSLWIPVWDSNGARSKLGASLELAALTYVAFPYITSRR